MAAVATKSRTARTTADPRPRTALVIGNPNARRGDELDNVRDALEAEGLKVTLLRTRSRNELTPAVVEHAGGVDCVVVAGGDGTMNAAADGLMQTGLPLGIMPMGTANDLARTLDIPVDMAGAARIVAAGKRKKIDLGEVNEHAFFNVASIGLATELAQKLTKERKRRFGRLAYAMTALHVLSTIRPFRAAIVSKEGTTRVSTLQISVGNGRYYGGGMTVEADARIDDGHLDLYSLEFDRVWKLALLARSFRSGMHGLWREVRTEKCVSFEVRTRKPLPVNADGDLVTFTPARFLIRPEAVDVYVP